MDENDGLSFDSDQIQIICDNMLYPPNSIGSLTEQDFASVHPPKELTKAALDYLLSSLVPTDENAHINHFSFHIWPGIHIHDPVGTDDTATWSPQADVKPFNSSRYQLLPYFASHHWQLAVFDIEDHIIHRYDTFWSDGIDLFTFFVYPITFPSLVYLHQVKVLQRWLDKNGGNPHCLRYRHDPVKVGNLSQQDLQ